MTTTITTHTIQELDRRAEAGAPLTLEEARLLEDLRARHARRPLQGLERQAYLALLLRERLHTEGAGPPLPAPPAPARSEGARQRTERLRRTVDRPEVPSVEAMARASMRQLAIAGAPHVFAAAYNVQGCCASCRKREACFGNRETQLLHCFDVRGGAARLRCLEHREATEAGTAPADVCGGPGKCPEYENAFQETNDTAGVSA